MKVVKVVSLGGPEGLQVAEVPAVRADAGQVTIAVEASGVGLVDVLIRRGLHHGFSEPGFIPGAEVAGTVVATGDAVDKDWLGQRVFALTPVGTLGGYAEQVAVDVASLARIPERVSTTEAVALGVSALVAEFSLERVACQQKQEILVRGAGGGIGIMTVQLAMLKGARVTAVDSSPQKRTRLEALGVKSFLSPEQIAHAADLYNAIADSVAGPNLEEFVNLLRPNGHYVLNGVAGGFPAPTFGTSWLSRFQKSLTMSIVSLNSIPAGRLVNAMEAIFGLAASGRLLPVVAKSYPLANAAEAHRYLEAGLAFGKIVLKN